MARPKKTGSRPDARERIIEAFWGLLRENKLHEISIGMVVAKASCNRGTFYYHFEDKDALINAIINEEILGEYLPQQIFSLSTNSGSASLSSILTSQRIDRLSLFVEQGGGALIENRTKSFILRMWETALCPDGGRLSDETRSIIEYCSSGMLGLISYLGSARTGNGTIPPAVFLMENANLAIEHIRKAQGLSKEELDARLAIVTQMSSEMKKA